MQHEWVSACGWSASSVSSVPFDSSFGFWQAILFSLGTTSFWLSTVWGTGEEGETAFVISTEGFVIIILWLSIAVIIKFN